VVGKSGYKFIESYSEDALTAAMVQQLVVLQFDAGRPEFNDYISAIYEGPCTADPNYDLTLVGSGILDREEFGGGGGGRICLLEEGCLGTTMWPVWSHCFACLSYRLVKDPLFSIL
jgi:hypothetical protein